MLVSDLIIPSRTAFWKRLTDSMNFLSGRRRIQEPNRITTRSTKIFSFVLNEISHKQFEIGVITTDRMCTDERSKMSGPHFHYFTRITNKFVIYQEGAKLTFMSFSFHEFPELSFIVLCRITKSTYFSFCSFNNLFFTKVRKAFLESISEDPAKL